MIGLIVTGHGNFGTGLTTSLKLIAGDLENYIPVDFTQEVDQLAADLAKAMDDLKDCESILVLSDLPGGSPFKTAVEVGFPRGNVDVVSGTNLPMLITANMMRKFMDDRDAFVNMVLSEAAAGIKKFEFEPVVQVESEDGI